MSEIALTKTTPEIIEIMAAHGVEVNKHNVAYYRLLNNINMKRYEVVKPLPDFWDRIGLYINAIPNYRGDTWANKNIGCHGQSWTTVTKKLRDEKLIAANGRRPIRYSMLVPYEEILEWFENTKPL